MMETRNVDSLSDRSSNFTRVLGFHVVAIKEQIILCVMSESDNLPSFAGFIELSIESE
jgi:hypothetical protein